jgi:hypothetical protein
MFKIAHPGYIGKLPPMRHREGLAPGYLGIVWEPLALKKEKRI